MASDRSGGTWGAPPGQAGATGSLVDVISETGAVLPLAIGHLADRAGLPAAMAALTGLALLLVRAASRIWPAARTPSGEPVQGPPGSPLRSTSALALAAWSASLASASARVRRPLATSASRRALRSATRASTAF